MQGVGHPETPCGGFMSTQNNRDLSQDTSLHVFDELSRHLRSAGIAVPSYHRHNLTQFISLPADRKQSIVEHFNSYLDMVRAIRVEPGSTVLTTAQERLLVRKSAERFGLKLTDAAENTVEAGYLIEIYNAQNVQLYRNFEFFRHSGYSLLDVVTTEWYHLYQRPQKVTEALIEAAREVFTHGKAIVPNVPEHILRETRSDAQRAFLINVKSISPLFAQSGKVEAILTKIQAQLIAEGQDADRIGIA
jgi:hypothetical protein